MKNELWLEFGVIESEGWHDVSWYNEGRFNEIWFFIWKFLTTLHKKKLYFLIKRGENKYYLRNG